MLGLTQWHLRTAIVDIVTGARNWRLWHLLAWYEIKQRYRRSTLGPLWVTISMGIQMLVMGSLLTFLLKSNFGTFLPYICASFVIWTLVSQIVNDGAMAFITASSYILQIKKPLTIYIFQIVWRNLIIAGHNVIVYVVVACIFLIAPGPATLLLPVTLALAVLSIAWIALLLAILSTRYRDIPMMVQSIIGVLFWATPLLYRPEQLGDKRYLVDLNPFTYVVELIRAPLGGTLPAPESWLVVIAMIVVGWSVTLLFFARFRPRVPYWL